ncbi:hypothetical protein [Streptomyces sp. NPDC058623]|uniref:hypothetical protein n=1 Tax=Streptomyces sp. NPDC058623 TaxID=3346563 RepID=UPI00364D3F50
MIDAPLDLMVVARVDGRLVFEGVSSRLPAVSRFPPVTGTVFRRRDLDRFLTGRGLSIACEPAWRPQVVHPA